MKIILGSSSKYRKAILDLAGFEFEVVKPEINEKSIRTDDYYKLPVLIARAKSKVLQDKINDTALIITADQIIICDGKLLEKPSSKKEAITYLKKYSQGYPAETVSALVVFNTKSKKIAEGVDVAKIFFSPIPDFVIESYIKTGEAFLTSGGFDHSHSILLPYVKKTEGAPDSISGMPLKLLKDLIDQVS